MASSKPYRQLPTASRAQGLPAIGFELETELPITPDVGAVRCSEQRADGRPIGELAVEVFAAALVIDRDGILAAKASERAGGAPAVAVVLPGVSGYRADAITDDPLRYVHVFAMAPDLGVDAGVLVTIRSARPEWPAAESILRSLRLLTRHGSVPVAANDESAPLLPLVED
ncbi:MAG TPA: hypothetical protein VFQ53_07885 [Kofleriaceae bacterium]|nr:hypothetical protein [Kofleriaceae bacterium]